MRLVVAVLLTMLSACAPALAQTLTPTTFPRLQPLICVPSLGPIAEPLCHPPQGLNFGVGAGNHFDISSGDTGFQPFYVAGGGGSAAIVSHSADASFQLTTSVAASTWVQIGFSNRPWPYGEAPRCFAQSETPGTGATYAPSTTAGVIISWDNSMASVRLSVLCVGF